jgi:predicted P-loop ATPase
MLAGGYFMSKQLLIVGEPEAVPAAQTLLGDVCEVVAYADTLDVKERKIVYWPTSPGTGALARAQTMAITAVEVKVLITGDKPIGWNATAAVAEGWDVKKFIEWAKQRTVPVMPVAPEDSVPTESQAAALERLGLMVSKQGVPICNMANVILFLERSGEFKGKLWHDEFTNQMRTDSGSWTDLKTLQLLARLQSELGMHKLTSSSVHDAVVCFTAMHRRHQVRDWLNKLVWDKKERIGTFFPDYCGAEKSASHYAFSSNFWVSLVKRIFEPGCQSDYMVVLEGEQGIGKTKAFQTIGGDWYAEVGITADSEDFERQLQGKILVEIAELHSFSKAEQSRVKQIITKRVDRYREKYGRVAVDHPRLGLLVGTTNETEWIKDQTGGRRFWPVKCGEIDSKGIQRDREQLFAEAVLRYREGDPGYFVPKEEVKELQEDRRESEPWEELLKEKLMLLERISLVEAMALLGIPNERMDNRLSKRVAQALRRLGFNAKSFKIQGEVKRFWYKNGVKP